MLRRMTIPEAICAAVLCMFAIGSVNAANTAERDRKNEYKAAVATGRRVGFALGAAPTAASCYQGMGNDRRDKDPRSAYSRRRRPQRRGAPKGEDRRLAGHDGHRDGWPLLADEPPAESAATR